MSRRRPAVSIVRTRYPHWGEHTAFNAMLPLLDRGRFRITVSEVPLRRGSRVSRPLSRRLLRWLEGSRLREYGWGDLWAELRVLRSALRAQIDLVCFVDAEHSFRFLPGWLRGLVWLRSAPRVVAMYHQPPSVLEDLVDVGITRAADHLLTVAPEQARYFARFMPADRISTILLGVDTGHFNPPVSRKGDGRLRCLGGGIWLRDYQALFDTAKLLAGVPEIEFHLVAPEFTVRTVAGNVHFHEAISDAALLEFYRACHVLFLPLRDATANTFLLEGCACGLPIVSSALPSVRAYFPGEEATLVEGNDPSVFAQVITRLWREPSLREHMSACARRRALELSWERVVKEYEEMFLQVLGTSERRPRGR